MASLPTGCSRYHNSAKKKGWKVNIWSAIHEIDTTLDLGFSKFSGNRTYSSYDKPRQCIKKQKHRFADKGLHSQSYGFSGSHVQMWELDHKESWVLKNLCFWTVVLEKTLESPLDSKEIKPVNPKGNQPCILPGRTDAEAEALILWLLNVKSWLIEKDPDMGKDWGQEEKGITEDETVGWHHQLDGHEFEQTPGDNEGQGSLEVTSPKSHCH